jgi:NAD(P)-dependent dehydrogenase (short-subunit alcohol dehydrogenase family)
MKTVLITGAGGNLGRAAVRKFMNDSWFVLATVSPGKQLPEITPEKGEVFALDLRDEVRAESLVSEIVAKYRRLDVALFLAGGYAGGGIEKTGADQLQRMSELNFNTTYFAARHTFLYMKKQGRGRIVFIGARPALEPDFGKHNVAYALSKSLLLRLAEYFNADAGTSDIVTHIIVPATIDTPENRKAMPDADTSGWVSPDEIAEKMLSVCSPETVSGKDTVIKLYEKRNQA